jgi:hypothetical protein
VFVGCRHQPEKANAAPTADVDAKLLGQVAAAIEEEHTSLKRPMLQVQ